MTSIANFPVECLEDVFRHLSGSDLLAVTMVCPEWNKFIGSTRSCMEKISLRYFYDDPRDNMKIILMNSKRKYERLELAGNYSEDHQKLLSLGGRRWMHIFARFLKFKTVQQYLDFLRIFQSSIRSLDLHDGAVKGDFESNFETTDLLFP